MDSYSGSPVGWPPGSRFSNQTPGSRSYSSTQDSPQPIEEGTTSNYSIGPYINGAVQEYKHYGTRGLIPHPVQGMRAYARDDGTVAVVFGPPLCEINIGSGGPEFSLLSEEPPVVVVPQVQHTCGNSVVMVPQVQYTCGNTQKDWKPKETIYFNTGDRLGVKLSDVFRGVFSGMIGRDDTPFSAECRGITIRMHFLGYDSSTDVEKTLKHKAEGNKGAKARSMQLSTKNYKVPPEPVTRSKLAQEVSKRIKWHIGDLEANSALFQFNDQVGQQWRLGQGGMKFERMVMTELVNVSSGSWSPTICIEQDPTGPRAR